MLERANSAGADQVSVASMSRTSSQMRRTQNGPANSARQVNKVIRYAERDSHAEWKKFTANRSIMGRRAR